MPGSENKEIIINISHLKSTKRQARSLLISRYFDKNDISYKIYEKSQKQNPHTPMQQSSKGQVVPLLQSLVIHGDCCSK